MNTFTYWYKKEIKARNLEQANRRSKNLKPTLDSVSIEEDKADEKTPCIGFMTDDYDDDF